MKNEFKTGIFFTAIAQYSTVIVQLLINMILSRLLTPKEIGMVTIVQVIIFFFQLLAGSALGPAIVQNKQLDNNDYGILFNFSIMLGVFLALIFGIGGGFGLSAIYNNGIYISLCWSMAPIIIMGAMGQVPNGILSKEKRFKEISLRLLLSGVLGAAFGIVAAFLHAGVYSMVLVFIVTDLFSLLLNLRMTKIKYTKSLSFVSVRKILPFFKNQTSFSIINYLYRNLDNLMIGKFLGAFPLGNYSKSYQLLSLPVTVFLSVINPVMQPILAEYETNVDLIRETYLKVCRILAFIAIPISIFFCLNSEEIIYLLFGRQWTLAIVPLSFLSLSIWAQMLAQSMPAIWQVRNLTNIQAVNGVLSLIVIGASIILGITFGSITNVAIAVSLAYILNFIISASLLMNRALESNLFYLLKELIKPALLGIFLALVLVITNPYLEFSNLFLTLLIRGIFWIFLIAAFLAAIGELKTIKEMVKG